MDTIYLPVKRPFNWKVFFIIVGYSFLASWALMPLFLTLNPPAVGETWLSNAVKFVFQETIMTGLLSAGIGLFLATRIGLGLPFIEGWLDKEPIWHRFQGALGLSIIASVIGIISTLVVGVIFSMVILVLNIDLTKIGIQVNMLGDLAAWKWLLASLYGAAEEIPFRLGLLTLLAWLGSLVSCDSRGRPTMIVFWVANFLAALVFGVGHLYGVMPYPEMPIFMARIVVQNTLIGMILGWLYWNWGLETAMMAHFLVDVLLYVILQPLIQEANLILAVVIALALILLVWRAWRAVAEDNARSLPTSTPEQASLRRWRWWLVGIGILISIGSIFWLTGLIQEEHGALARDLEPTQTPHATLATGSIQVSEIDGMRQVYIPAGNFEMGSSSGGSDERPAHKVYLDAFWIDQTEVTNAMYARCVGAGACTLPRLSSSETRPQYYGNPAYDNYPVIYVDWRQAVAYCAWAGRRLPTEAEWEKAARGTDGYGYPWGDAPPDDTRSNCNVGLDDTTAVGSYPDGASPFGALDMSGNVFEWVADCYGRSYYGSAPIQNPMGPVTCEHQHRVFRGGCSWVESGHSYAVITDRLNNLAEESGADLGFRCALSP